MKSAHILSIIITSLLLLGIVAIADLVTDNTIEQPQNYTQTLLALVTAATATFRGKADEVDPTGLEGGHRFDGDKSD